MSIKSTLEKVISEDLAAIWSLLNAEEKRLITDNFEVHNFKKNQIIYAEKDSPVYLWCLLKGKVKLWQAADLATLPPHPVLWLSCLFRGRGLRVECECV